MGTPSSAGLPLNPHVTEKSLEVVSTLIESIWSAEGIRLCLWCLEECEVGVNMSRLPSLPLQRVFSLWTTLHPISADEFKHSHHSVNISVAYFGIFIVFKRSDFVTSLKNLRQFGIFHRNKFYISSSNVQETQPG